MVEARPVETGPEQFRMAGAGSLGARSTEFVGQASCMNKTVVFTF